MPSVFGQPAAQFTTVVRAVDIVFCAMNGSALNDEERSDCGCRERTYVALCLALGSEPPPAIV